MRRFTAVVWALLLAGLLLQVAAWLVAPVLPFLVMLLVIGSVLAAVLPRAPRRQRRSWWF